MLNLPPVSIPATHARVVHSAMANDDYYSRVRRSSGWMKRRRTVSRKGHGKMRASQLSVETVCETGDIVVEPYQDPSNSVENRVEDLLARLTVEDKAGLMFHDIVAMEPGGQLMGANNSFGRPAT